MSKRSIKVYTDYKSPYAYLAKDSIYELAESTGVDIDWLPYTLDIPSYLGSAELDANGAVLAEQRNAHQWRRIKYSYMDCRREANRRGLVIRGTRKIWDSSLANIGMLYAKENGGLRPYHDSVFERFWKRDLDIEDVAAVCAVLSDAGVDCTGFETYASRAGRRLLADIQSRAEAIGVFGVPSILLGDDLYWGREHLPHVKAILLERGA